MRAIALSLLVANLLVFAWVQFRTPVPPPETPTPLRASPLVLLGELPPREAAPAPPEPVLPQPIPTLAEGCRGIGPYADREVVIAARDELLSLGINALPRATDASQLLGYWVHTPPAESREAAAATVDRLRRAGIRDFYMISDEERQNAISLGVFGQPEAAEQHAARLRALGFDVRVGERRRRMTAWWLEFEAPPSGSPTAASLTDLVSASEGVRLEIRPCEN